MTGGNFKYVSVEFNIHTQQLKSEGLEPGRTDLLGQGFGTSQWFEFATYLQGGLGQPPLNNLATLQFPSGFIIVGVYIERVYKESAPSFT